MPLDRLIEIADQAFADAGIPKAALALWRPRFHSAALGFIEVERQRRGTIAVSHLEKTRRAEVPGAGWRIHLVRTGRPYRRAEQWKRGDPGLQDRRHPHRSAGAGIAGAAIAAGRRHSGGRRLSRYRKADRRRVDLSLAGGWPQSRPAHRHRKRRRAGAGSGGKTGAAHCLVRQ